MGKIYKKDRIIKLARENPEIENKTIASQLDCDVKYVRDVRWRYNCKRVVPQKKHCDFTKIEVVDMILKNPNKSVNELSRKMGTGKQYIRSVINRLKRRLGIYRNVKTLKEVLRWIHAYPNMTDEELANDFYATTGYIRACRKQLEKAPSPWQDNCLTEQVRHAFNKTVLPHLPEAPKDGETVAKAYDRVYKKRMHCQFKKQEIETNNFDEWRAGFWPKPLSEARFNKAVEDRRSQYH